MDEMYIFTNNQVILPTSYYLEHSYIQMLKEPLEKQAALVSNLLRKLIGHEVPICPQ